jgi:predicted negative regulator of RcsB-dependent stress response
MTILTYILGLAIGFYFGWRYGQKSQAKWFRAEILKVQQEIDQILNKK